jgi:hypothetical protein
MLVEALKAKLKNLVLEVIWIPILVLDRVVEALREKSRKYHSPRKQPQNSWGKQAQQLGAVVVVVVVV